MFYTLQRSYRSNPNKIIDNRMQIKRFTNANDMGAFQSKQCDNKWSVSNYDFKSGHYAYAGGQWHNIKSLDVSILAHI